MSLFTANYTDADDRRLPETEPGADFRVELYRVVGVTAADLLLPGARTLVKRMDVSQVGLDWTYDRIGGCGAFTLKVAGGFPDLSSMQTEKWELDISRIDSVGMTTLWYRAVVEAPVIVDGSATLKGFGNAAALQGIQLAGVVYQSMTVAAIVQDILDVYVLPNSRIDYSAGDLFGNYLVNDVRFDCSAFQALSILAELQGTTEWGVDANRSFYFLQHVITIQPQNSFFVSSDLSGAHEGYTFTEGTPLGANVFMMVGGISTAGVVVTGIYDGSAGSGLGQRAYRFSRPEIRNTTDANRICENWFNQCSAGSSYYSGTVPVHDANDVPRRIEAAVPIGNIKFSNAGSNVFGQLWSVKYGFVEGCAYTLQANITIGIPPASALDTLSTAVVGLFGANISRTLQAVNITPTNPVTTTAVNLPLTAAHRNIIVTAAATITLPAAVTGRTYTIKSTVAGNVVVDTADAGTIDGDADVTMTVQYDSITVVCDGTNWSII